MEKGSDCKCAPPRTALFSGSVFQFQLYFFSEFFGPAGCLGTISDRLSRDMCKKRERRWAFPVASIYSSTPRLGGSQLESKQGSNKLVLLATATSLIAVANGLEWNWLFQMLIENELGK